MLRMTTYLIHVICGTTHLHIKIKLQVIVLNAIVFFYPVFPFVFITLFHEFPFFLLHLMNFQTEKLLLFFFYLKMFILTILQNFCLMGILY